MNRKRSGKYGRIQAYFLACGIALIGAAVPLNFAHAQAPAAPAASTPAAPKMVFAHYMLAFGSSVEFYKQEIELAQRHGIDGFALNAGEWMRGEGVNSNYVPSGERMYEAAKQLNSGFKLFFSPDLNGLGGPMMPVNIGDMVTRFKDHPNQFRHNGKVVLSGWGGNPAVYADSVNKIKAAGTDVFFVPFVYNPRYSINWSPETVHNFFQDQPHMDGIFNFGADAIIPEIMRTNAIARRVTTARGKVFMAGVSPAFNSPNLRDYRGMRGYGDIWEGFIRDGADWVEIVTWNDYQEDSNLMPFRWPAGATREHLSRDESFLDLTGYYSAWFKTGVRPTIPQDKLYYAYRNRSKHLTRGWNPDTKEWYDITSGVGAVDQIHDDVEDNVYVTTFLTAPAELVVRIGTTEKTFNMPAGVGHAAMPMQPGTPRFIVRRKTGNAVKPVLDISGRKLIIEKETEENSPKGYHFHNRTWTGAAVAGPVTRMEAETGTLSEGATIVKTGAVSAVQNEMKDNSGFTLPVKNLATGVYNVRIVYSNPNPTEARLTLLSNGVPRAEKEHEYFLPAFLPPTAKGQFATTSFLWSLYDQTSYLKLAWLLGREWGTPKPAMDDKGVVLIDAIELVPVTPVKVPAMRDATNPELVSIPGGTFLMGSKADDKEASPDEKPQRSVTLSPFSIGRTEVTNAQFEKFAPDHRALRDEYSWRDSDPVIYVSWPNAASYCNWLSTQQNLTPVYDEKTWQANPKANGYRLPSEAEWEYVASGRGENRKYPWGNTAPDASRGNFLLSTPAASANNFIGPGTAAVGSFPAGASRDGVLDLAGNVSEWCGDFYGAYPATAQTDPLNQTASNYRILRGSSWGYYGMGARAADREFNSPGYPGYIYNGFRIARSTVQ